MQRHSPATPASPAPASGRPFRTLPHITGLFLIVVGALIVGRPVGWLGFAAALGPPIGAAIGAVTNRDTGPWRESFAFGLVAATLIGGGWVLLQLPGLHSGFLLLWPVALLAFLLGSVNFVAVSLSRAWRATKHEPLDYPWIPRNLGRALGLSGTDKSRPGSGRES